MIAYLKPMSEKAEPVLLPEFLTLGRETPGLHLLENATVEDRHARIEVKDGKVTVRDLRSISGTFVNETRVVEAQINPGDVIRVGSAEFQYCIHETTPTPQLSSRNPDWNRGLQSIPNLAKTSFPVLLLGPSGTGKDVVAQEIHRCSPRASAPFISVNCSALTETLVESELFGHVKGSFTGAIADRKGAFESARGGTLFLDEIGDLPSSLQAKILRALENNEIRPVGSDRTIKTNVRIIAATHQNLHERIQLGQFRSDLYYRLSVVQLCPPALSQRMEDFEDLLMQFARQYKVRFSMPAISQMKKHAWPGNIRELKNTVARARALLPDTYILEEHMPQLLDRTLEEPTLPAAATEMSQMPVLKEIEKQMIIKRLIANRGNQRRTAQDLGIPKSTLHDRLRTYSIDVNQFKV
ncbi:MAG: sigma 54-interacting transcriptional regulator [Bdellovibrionales bacterium]